jgi:hypothetical protein
MNVMLDRSQPQPSTDDADDAFQRMHVRLLEWGLCFLRGGANIVDVARPDIVRVNNKTGAEAVYQQTSSTYREMDPTFERRDWTQPQIEAAGRLHSRVTALPIQRSLVLQVYYFQEDAEFWSELRPAEQRLRVIDMTHWQGQPLGVNPRITRHNREQYDCVPPIVPELFMSIRHLAIRELMARERGMAGL